MLVLAGCGGGGHDASALPRSKPVKPSVTTVPASPAVRAAYTEAAQSVRTRLADLQSVGRAVSGTDTKSMLTFYRQLEAATRRSIRDYEAITPPPQVRSLHEHLLTVLADQARALDDLVTNVRTGATDEVGPDLARVTELLGDYATTNNELTSRLG